MSNPCVIAMPVGGLGNQLFIYAFCKALAERNGTPLRLDAHSGFERDFTYQRSFLLNRLVPELEISNRRESRQFPMGRWLRSLERRINRLLPADKRWLIEQSKAGFDQAAFDTKIVRPTKFRGLWQDHRYFCDLDVKSLIHFPDELIQPLQEEAQAIRQSNAVCLAIRRYEEVKRVGPRILDQEYFQRAMQRIEQQVAHPHYFVFAQDMGWAREHIRSEHPVTFATERDPHEGVIQDLYLMTQCRHFILSNSTLHWWAAWLGQNEESIVLAPASGWPNASMQLPPSWLPQE